jgi:hypothetical protein
LPSRCSQEIATACKGARPNHVGALFPGTSGLAASLRFAICDGKNLIAEARRSIASTLLVEHRDYVCVHPMFGKPMRAAVGGNVSTGNAGLAIK